MSDNQVELRTDSFGCGRRIIQGAHHLELELVRMLHGRGYPHVSPGPTINHAQLDVQGADPESVVQVTFKSPRVVEALPQAQPLGVVEAAPAPEPAPPASIVVEKLDDKKWSHPNTDEVFPTKQAATIDAMPEVKVDDKTKSDESGSTN